MNFKNQKTMEIDGWRVSDLPIEYGESDYEEARNEIVNHIRGTPGLVALFEYGYIPYPGISDMDFWGVFSDNAEKLDLPSHSELLKKTRHLMSHRIIVIPEKHYRKMLYFDPWTPIRWPNGHRLLYQSEDAKRNLNFENINFTKGEKDVLNALCIEESMVSLNTILPIYARKELPVRHVLETIKGCVYISSEVESLTGRKINSDFSKNFQDLRLNWFKLDPEQAVRRLIKLFYDSLLINFESAFYLGDWIVRRSKPENIRDLGIRRINFLNRSSLDKGANNIYFNTCGNRQVFTDFVHSPVQALELSVNSCRKSKIGQGRYHELDDFYIVFQPLTMAAISLGFCFKNNSIDKNLIKDIFSNQKTAFVFSPKILKEKLSMENEMAEIYGSKLDKNMGGKEWRSGINLFRGPFGNQKIIKKLMTLWLKRKFWRAVDRVIKV